MQHSHAKKIVVQQSVNVGRALADSDSEVSPIKVEVEGDESAFPNTAKPSVSDSSRISVSSGATNPRLTSSGEATYGPHRVEISARSAGPIPRPDLRSERPAEPNEGRDVFMTTLPADSFEAKVHPLAGSAADSAAITPQFVVQKKADAYLDDAPTARLVSQKKADACLDEAELKPEQRLEQAINTHNAQSFMQCVYSPDFDSHRRDAGNKNRTWLHKAASVGSAFAAALLLEKSADLLCKDSDGNTALELAIGAGHTDCALLLAKRTRMELDRRNVATLDCNAPLGKSKGPAFKLI